MDRATYEVKLPTMRTRDRFANGQTTFVDAIVDANSVALYRRPVKFETLAHSLRFPKQKILAARQNNLQHLLTFLILRYIVR